MPSPILLPTDHAKGLAEALVQDNDLVDVIALVTAHVRPSFHRRADPAFVLTEFRHCYANLSRELLGSNFHRPVKRAQAPRTLVAYDRQGSRHPATRPDQINVGPHAHAVIALVTEFCRTAPNDLAGAIRRAVLRAEAFETVHVRLVPYHLDALTHLIDYGTKDARYLEASGRWPDIAYDLIAPAPYRRSIDRLRSEAMMQRATEVMLG